MAIVRAGIEIDAAAAHVFDILTDLDRYPEWNPFTPRAESSLEIGAPVHLYVRLRSQRLRHQVEYVTANEPPSRLCWGADILGRGSRFLARADRCQTLTPVGPHRTLYECTDEITGWLTPVVMRLFGPAMQRGFEDCAFALKKRAER